MSLDAKGDLFGTCQYGGATLQGSVRELIATGSFNVLHSFGATTTDGWSPEAGVTVDTKGDLFGTRYSGGAKGRGTLWEMTSSGSYKTLYSFEGTITDGFWPESAVALDAKGNLYGTCIKGGPNGGGTVWELSPS